MTLNNQHHFYLCPIKIAFKFTLRFELFYHVLLLRKTYTACPKLHSTKLAFYRVPGIPKKHTTHQKKNSKKKRFILLLFIDLCEGEKCSHLSGDCT